MIHETSPRARPPDLTSPAPPVAALELVDVHTHLRSPRGIARAVDGVSLQVSPGRMLGVVGESGSGKTVLLRTVMGLLPPGVIAHSSGEVRLGGVDILGLPERDLRHYRGGEVAMVFQDPMTALNPVMTVGQQLAQSVRAHRSHMRRTEVRQRALELLADAGIREPRRRVGQYAGELSGGLRQRVMIAMALSGDPRVLLADEPTTALDVTVQAQILDLLRRLQRERNLAVLFVSHDLELMARVADDVLIMYAGRAVERGPAADVLATPRMPYTAALLHAAPQLDMPSHTRLPVIGGRPPDLTDLPDGCAFHPRCPAATERCRVESPMLCDDEDQAGRTVACWWPVAGGGGGEDGR